ncbi:MAG: LOG family protein [Candidatus Paceibacterota bacterium]
MKKDFRIIESVAFFGYSLAKEREAQYKAAYDIAKYMGQSGRLVVNGGGPGIMYAATKGAKDGGGEVSVVYYEPKFAQRFEGKSGINIADKHEKEANYILRTKRLLDLADAYIVFNGGTGTMSEFAMAWGVARLYFGHHKPLILYGKSWKPLIEAFRKHTKIRDEAFRVYKIATTPKEAIDHLEGLEERLHKHTLFHHKICEDDECKLYL